MRVMSDIQKSVEGGLIGPTEIPDIRDIFDLLLTLTLMRHARPLISDEIYENTNTKLVRQHPGSTPVPEPRVRIPPLDLLLDPPDLCRELIKRLDRLRISRPNRPVLPLPDILLVGRVGRQRVDHRHEFGRLQEARERAKEVLLRVTHEPLVLRVGFSGQEPTHEGRAVWHVASVRVLPEVEGRVLGGREPDEGREDGR
ncbi:ribosomal protein S12 methylthiotransferase RimO [Striga asiatica]|uniref:Ribosomal protein S12 methylthiotransferase RimO n=1 Tax=Striga asiatica TaxID=4170 RepID=A0A5A7P6V1_STRAF|nr:ribosomal protein S12 methylthiotransferase RimO [Striga asiatica]